MSTRSPVLDVYDLFRTARLNVKYLEARIKQMKQANFWIELLLAFSASSTVAGLWVWESAWGGYAWKLVGTVAAILAVLKPILNLTKKIQGSEKSLIAYLAWDHDLYKLTVLINQRQAYDAEMKKEFLKHIDTRGELIKIDAGSKKNEKLREQCYQQVLTEIPSESLFVPEN